jgi:hypothetical protein
MVLIMQTAQMDRPFLWGIESTRLRPVLVEIVRSRGSDGALLELLDIEGCCCIGTLPMEAERS